MMILLQALKSVVLYVILSPYDNEQSDLVHRISADKKLEEIPKYKYGFSCNKCWFVDIKTPDKYRI